MQAFVLQPNLFQLQNVGRVAHRGVDLDLRTSWGTRFDTSVTYSYLNRETKSTPAVPLFNLPAHKFLASAIAMPLPRLQLSGVITVESSRPVQNEGGRILTVPDYATLDLKSAWRFTQNLSLEGGLLNAFDRNYALADGYPQPGRIVFASVRAAVGRRLP